MYIYMQNRNPKTRFFDQGCQSRFRNFFGLFFTSRDYSSQEPFTAESKHGQMAVQILIWSRFRTDSVQIFFWTRKIILNLYRLCTDFFLVRPWSRPYQIIFGTKSLRNLDQIKICTAICPCLAER